MNHSNHSRSPNGVANEQSPLLPRPKSRPGSVTTKLRKTLNAEVSRTWADIVLLLCYIVTGLLDSASTQAWGAFVSMQTGNTIYVGLGLASIAYPPISPRLWRSGISLLCFCLGSFLFARFHRFFSPKRRWVLCVSFMAQTLLCVAAATIVTVRPPKPGDDSTDWNILVPIALVALQSCGQAVTSRALKYNTLTSVVLTSIYCDLFSDQDLFSINNPERNRRVAAPLLLLSGAVIGGFMSRSSVGVMGALWLASLLKFATVVTWFLWPADDEEE